MLSPRGKVEIAKHERIIDNVIWFQYVYPRGWNRYSSVNKARAYKLNNLVLPACYTARLFFNTFPLARALPSRGIYARRARCINIARAPFRVKFRENDEKWAGFSDEKKKTNQREKEEENKLFIVDSL